MPYPCSRDDRAWELFVAVWATKAAIHPHAIRQVAREAYRAADGFEEVYRQMSPEKITPDLPDLQALRKALHGPEQAVVREN
jgi:hypothetical protein